MAAYKKSRSEEGDGRRAGSRQHDASDQKVRKACINCRRQKMKCLIAENSDACRRCQRSGLPCVFLPRANAATLPEEIMSGLADGDGEFKSRVLHRLKVIEERLGISDLDAPKLDKRDGDNDVDFSPDYHSLSGLWQAADVLEKSSPSSVPSIIWKRSTIKDLWSSFHDRMPGLHFMPRKQTFPAPQPLLLASVLYCSSSRGPPEMSEIAAHYYTVVCNAIGQLCVPDSSIGMVPENSEEWAFQTVLGIVLAGLLTEANVRETGIWISIAYRLILEHCPAHIEESSREWRKLFSGVQIVDLEHASLHLSCPIIPAESPLPGLQTPNSDQLYRLSRMMHTGLRHFTGRGLPTIWSCFGRMPQTTNLIHTFTAVDAAVIRDWARQLDDWLVEFSQRVEGSEQDRGLVFRQYVLHRLLVLSIYHPARGFDLWPNAIPPKEQHELLLSARATLKLHLHDDSIWSNWDFVMITWAALIVVQGIEGGVGEADDLDNIRIHLDIMKKMNSPKPSIYDKLILRLEESLAPVHTPGSLESQANTYNDIAMSAQMDQSWQIFDQASFQQMIYPAWSSL